MSFREPTFESLVTASSFASADLPEHTFAGDHVSLKPVDIDGDTFGMTVVALARDSYFLARHTKEPQHEVQCARWTRLTLVVLLCFLTIFVQTALLLQVKRFVCAREVHDIRLSYNLYEKTIYGEENCTLSPHGHFRGDLAKFNPSEATMEFRLSSLKDSDQDDICRIPLSQPYFFGLILSIWTLTCVSELRKTFTTCRRLMVLPTVDTMLDGLEESEDSDATSGAAVVVGLTIHLKVVFFFISVCRWCITSFLLWVGCRWLLATTSFQDLILNAVALEFILLLKEGFYMALVPARNKLDVEITKVRPRWAVIPSSLWRFTATFVLLVVTIGWVLLYMFTLQDVLPDFKWDVHSACVEYVKKRFQT